MSNICEVCGNQIQVMAFKGTGVCCDLHRKVRAGEMTLEDTKKFQTINPNTEQRSQIVKSNF